MKYLILNTTLQKIMGRGDKRTKKGKRFMGSNGKSRLKNNDAQKAKSAAKAETAK